MLFPTHHHGMPSIIDQSCERTTDDRQTTTEYGLPSSSDQSLVSLIELAWSSSCPKVSQAAEPRDVDLFDPALWTWPFTKVSKCSNQDSKTILLVKMTAQESKMMGRTSRDSQQSMQRCEGRQDVQSRPERVLASHIDTLPRILCPA